MPFMHNSTITTMTPPVEREMRRDLAELAAVANGAPTDNKKRLQTMKVDENGGTTSLLRRTCARIATDKA